MQKTLNCNGKIVSLKEPLVMGIINLNNDSFYEGSRSITLSSTLEMVGQMLKDGADIIDIGYMSSKPGSIISHPEEEAEAISIVVTNIRQKYPEVLISVDTLHSLVAQAAVIHGADMINDISGGSYDAAMMQTVAALRVPFIMMHMQGLPSNMQDNPQYNDVVYEVLVSLKDRLLLAREKGIVDVIIDPGFGFGKTVHHNFSLLKHLSTFKILDVPILAGLSRKSMIWKTLQTTPDHALNGTTALHFYALQQGANILRVHDVKAAVECIQLYKALMQAD
ncbi:MAG: dihydropteroate synthase [Chitinophagales bacterium]|nr:dihydropteroate synthase [Chitinophagales bacterium]